MVCTPQSDRRSASFSGLMLLLCKLAISSLFQDGFTSLAHPWSSGPTQWLSEHIAGFGAAVDVWEKGGGAGASRSLQPHLGRDMKGLLASLPLPDKSSISIGVKIASEDFYHFGGGSIAEDDIRHALIVIGVPHGMNVELKVSQVLAARLLSLNDEKLDGNEYILLSSETLQDPRQCDSIISRFSTEHVEESNSSSAIWIPRNDTATLQFSPCCNGPLTGNGFNRSSIAIIRVPAGECTRFKFKLEERSRSFDSGAVPPASHPNPFPPPSYPAYFMGADQATAGDWIGSYGASGYFLAAFDGTGRHVSQVRQVYRCP
jgi:hypothetical protein